MAGENLERAAIRAGLALHAERMGLRLEVRSGRWLIASPAESFFVVAPAGGGYATLILPLVVEERFVDEKLRELLGVVSDFDVCLYPEESEGLAPGEIYINLCLRLFLEGLNGEVFRLAIENLRAARSALGAAFP